MALWAGDRLDLKAVYRALWPAQQQAVQIHMDQHFEPCHSKAQENMEEYFEELMLNTIRAELPQLFKTLNLARRNLS